LETPLRVTLRLTMSTMSPWAEAAPLLGALREPFAETAMHRPPLGLHEDPARPCAAPCAPPR